MFNTTNPVKHSVLMLTYNHEKLVSIAIESLINQQPQPYEIIIGDDCSTDKTWEIITKYQESYPNLIKSIRQPSNIGIYAHLNYLVKKPTGDIISLLSGDDFFKPGIFHAFNQCIDDNHLNPSNEKFILITDIINRLQSGKENILYNSKLINEDLFKMKLRHDLIFRDTGYSLALFKVLPLYRTDLGINADYLRSLDEISHSDRFYFINKPFPVYNLGQGIASKTTQKISAKSRQLVINEAKQRFKSKLDEKDNMFLDYEYSLYSTLESETIIKYLKTFILLLNNFNNFTPNKSIKSELFNLINHFLFFLIHKFNIQLRIASHS